MEGGKEHCVERSLRFLVSAASPLLVSSPALAFSMPAGGSSLALALEDQQARGEGSADRTLVMRVVGALDPSLLPPSLREAAAADEGATGCLTSLLLDLKTRWPFLSPQERGLIHRVLPGFAEGESSGDPALAAAAFGCAMETEGSLETDHFVIKWGSDSQDRVNEDGIEALAQGLEDSRQVFLDLGYQEPAGIGQETGDGAWKLPVFMGNTGEGNEGIPTIGWSGGYTTLCNDQPGAAYIVLSNDMEDSGMMGWEVAAHELYHAVQFGYNRGLETWYWEASATWAEDLAFPDSNGFAWFTEYQNAPWVALNYSNSSHEYSMYVLPTVFEEQEAYGIDLMRDIWAIQGSSAIPEAFDALLQESGTTFVEAFGRFTGFAAYMSVEDRQVIQLPVTSDMVSEFPSEITTPDDPPEMYGTNYIRLDPPAEGEEGMTKLMVEFDGGHPDWVVALSRIREDFSALVKVAVPDEEGKATLTGIDFGTLYDPAFLAVSSTTGEDTEYTVQFSLQAQTEEPGSDEPPPPDAGDDDDDESSGSGCGGSSPFAVHPGTDNPNGGCDSAPSPGTVWGVLGLGVALALRRSRRHSF